jgi:hypothetical protein
VSKRDIGNTARFVTKVTWTNGQGSSRLSLGGKAVLGRAAGRPAIFVGRLFFWQKKERPHWAALTHPDFLAPIAIFIMISVLIVVAIARLMAILIPTMAIFISIAGAGVAIIAVMVVSYPLIFPVAVIPETLVLVEARIVLVSPLQILTLAFAV